jgi:hypothetical protein
MGAVYATIPNFPPMAASRQGMPQAPASYSYIQESSRSEAEVKEDPSREPARVQKLANVFKREPNDC